MNRKDCLIAFGMALLAAFIWLRDTAWVTSSDDTLPILMALPLFVWLGIPWQWQTEEPDYSATLLTAGVCSFTLGIGLNFTLLLAAGWVILLSAWLTARLQPNTLPYYYKLLPLPLLSFPWVSLDFVNIGWWFRLSGAWVTDHLFGWTGFNVVREGTLLTINGLPISIDVACAGLNTLQSMLISGTVVAYILLAHTSRYWLSFPILFGMAWVANTARIIIICLLALSISPAFVMGPFHTWGGWGVLMLTFALCWAALSLLKPRERT